MVKQSLDFAESMNKMAQKTGIAVEQLSELAYAAKLADVSQETLGKGIKNLNEYMVAANNPTSQQARLLKELGVNIKGDTLTAMQQLAKMYEILPDGATKAALSTEIFKKAGQDMIPFLNQGAESMRKMMEEARRLGLTLSTETAKQAEQFNDNIKTLQASTGRFGIVVVNEFAPALVKATEAMKEALLESGKLKAAWVGLGAVGAAIFTDDGLSAQQKVNREIKMLQERLAALNKEKLDGGSTLAIIANLGQEGALDSLNNQIAVATRRLNELQGGQAAEEQARKAAAARAKEEAERKEAEGKAAEERLRAKLAQQQAADEIAKHNEKLRQLDIKGWVDYADKVFEEADKLNTELAKLDDERNKLEEKYNEERLKAIDALAQEQAKVLDGLREQIEARQLEIDTFGMSKQASLEYAAGLLEARAASLSLDEATEAQIASLKAQAQLMRDLAGREGSLEAMQQQAKANEDAFKSVFGMLEGGFRAALTGAKSFGDYLKNGLRNALYELVARPFIIQIAGSITGASGQVMSSVLGNSFGAGGGLLGSFGGLAGIGGSLASGLSGIGLNGIGQFVGGLTGAISGPGLTGAAGMGSSAAGMLSAAGPYIAAAIAAYQLFQTFRDKGENPKYRLGFGSSANAYASDSIFGRQGFVYAEGNDAANQATRQFQQGFAGLDSYIARFLTSDQMQAAIGRLNGVQSREFSFPKGDPTASEQLSLEYLKIKYSAVFADFNSNLSATIANFSGKSEDLIKYIGEQVTAYEQLNAMMDAVNAQIDGLNNNGLDALNKTLQSLTDNIDAAKEAFFAAKLANDPTKEVEAQKALMDAIMNRYNTERQLINQLAAQLDSVQSGRYDFGQSMSARFQSVGGAGMGSAAQVLRMQRLTGQANDATDPQSRLGYINQALGVMDQYVSTEQGAIRARYDALARQQQIAVTTQQDVITRRIRGLQTELDLVSQMQGVAEAAGNAIRSISFSGANPLSAFGRYDMQGADVASLQAQFRSSTGNARGNAANSLIQAIQGRLSSAGELFQRPTDEYLAAYNEAMAALAEVQGAAQSDAERALELQSSIEALTTEGNSLTQNLVDYTALMNTALDEFNASALPLYQQLAAQGDAAYEQLEQQATAQLDAVTRGLTIAEAQRELLIEIREQLRQLNDPVVSGDFRRNNALRDEAPIRLELTAGGNSLGTYVIRTVIDNGGQIRRELAQT